MLAAVGVITRGRKLWLRYKDERGQWVSKPTPYYVGQEKLAESALRTIRREVDRRVKAGLTGPLTVRAYAESWIKDRKAMGIQSAGDEATRLRKHALPRVGHVLLDELRPLDVREMVKALKREGKLAPRTIRHVYSTLAQVMRHAVADELIDAAPVTLPPGTLPPVEDKDPEWRAGAVYERHEVEALISDRRILADRRMLYGLKALAGVRHGEAAGLRWRHYTPDREPLGCLLVANSYLRPGTKTGRTREVPVHKTLAAMLAEWRLRWADTYGRSPEDEDLIIPTRGFRPRAPSDAQDQLKADLKTIGIRHRRGHDLRRAFISLAIADGARREHLEWVTHGAPRGRAAFDLYHQPPWSSLCEAVACLDVSRRKSVVVPLRSSQSRYSGKKAK